MREFNETSFWKIFDIIIKNFAQLPTIGIKTAQKFFEDLIENNSKIEDLIKTLQTINSCFKKCPNCLCLIYLNKCLNCENVLSFKNRLLVINSLNVFLNLIKNEFKTSLFFNFEKEISISKNITLKKLPIQKLIAFIKNNPSINEIILMFNFTAEGELTKNLLFSVLKKQFPNLKITSLAKGISKGSAVSYLDQYTFKKAFMNRKDVK